MGLSMCSISTGEQSNIQEFQYDMTWETSEEQEDTDDDNAYFNLGRMDRCRSAPDLISLEKATQLNRAETEHVLRSRAYSLRESLKDRRRSSVMNGEAELQAKLLCKMVTDDTLKHLSHTVRIAGTIVEKGVVINNELARQDSVLSKKMTDIEQVTQTLNGMRSWRSKLKSSLWKKEPKLNMKEFDSKRSCFSAVNLDLLKDAGLCPLSKLACSSSTILKATSEDTQQTRIKAGMGHLHKALDIIAVQQMDVALALDTQEGRLSMFENGMVTTNKKLNRIHYKM